MRIEQSSSQGSDQSRSDKQQAVRPVVPAQKKPRKRLSFGATMRLIGFFLVLGCIIAVVVIIGSIPKRYNFLVIGSDQRAQEAGRSDVLMVVSLTKSPKEPSSIITIPRDTRVEVEGHGLQKITHAYAFDVQRTDGKDLGNRDLTKSTVEKFLGIHIDGTAEVTFQSFQQIIDKLGGVNMGATGTINGEDALKIVRDRYREGGDFARANDQRDILVQTISEIKQQNAFGTVYDFLKNSSDSRITMSTPKFAMFAAYAVIRRGGHFSLADVHQGFVPGSGKYIFTPEFGKDLYYWVPDVEGTKKLVADWLS